MTNNTHTTEEVSKCKKCGKEVKLCTAFPCNDFYCFDCDCHTPRNQAPEGKEWEEEFDTWMSSHATLMGGISSNIIPDLKSFIATLLSKARSEAQREERERIAEYVANYTADICEKSQQMKNDIINSLTSHPSEK